MAQPAPLPTFSEIDVQSLRQKLEQGGQDFQLIDVREPQELAIAALPGFQPLPLSQYAVWESTIQQRFDPHAETYVLCHHGIRSAQMCAWLLQQGFTSVVNITGGIDAYSLLADPSIPRY